MKHMPVKNILLLIGFSFAGIVILYFLLGLQSGFLGLRYTFFSNRITPVAFPTTDIPGVSPEEKIRSETITMTGTPTPFSTCTPAASFTGSQPGLTTPDLSGTETPETPVETAYSDLPTSAFVQGYEGHEQLFSLDCEARSAVDLADYFGVQIDVLEFLERLPRSDDPNEGFVGEVTDPWGNIPPASYGVYAGPVAILLQSYGLDATARTGMSYDELRWEVAAGKPVMVWVTGAVEPGQALTYIPANGEQTIVAHNEHTVTVIGYDETFVYIVDPGYNQFYLRKIDKFMASWGVLGNMAVVVE